MPPKRASSTPVPTTETGPQPESKVTNEEWQAMQRVLDNIYAYRSQDDYDPSKVFHRKVNKRVLPEYYNIIKEPMALSTIKAKINNREYQTFADFVRDFALIPHNAQVYNRPDAGAYQDALVIKGVIESELKKLVDEKIVDEETAKLPYLGEIPPQEEIPAEEEEEEDEDDEEGEEDEDDEDAGDDDEGGRPRKKRGPRSSTALMHRGGAGDKDDDPETRKKRGRPPKVHTPTEARIQAVLKGMRRPKNAKTQLINSFERLPDKGTMPDYYAEIKEPMAYDLLKRNFKRKKYKSLDEFMRDVDLMFENAKRYNMDESQIYKDAVVLQEESHRLADEERAKPDTDYVMEEGRIPMPDGILHNGELYKVGDWVHIQNVNDLTKPIPAQIYRTWQDNEGGKWVNVCWYYRPEQTVHRFDKHFLENEVVKTGQYRDHRIDEIVDRCFIMFFTRYYKGRPRDLPPDMEIYVCEARYNEEKFKFNKIKTWASCLPDEVRAKDYKMNFFDTPRKMKKFPSPIAYLLKDDAKETDDMPKPEWGAENAPPKIGAVHKRPRDPKDSPPPEPTPTPPPQPPPAPPQRQVPQMSPPSMAPNYSPLQTSATAAAPMTAASPARPQPAARTSYTPSHVPTYSASPAPVPQRTPSVQAAAFPPSTPQTVSAAPLPRTASHVPPYQAPIPPPSSSAFLQNRPTASSSYRDPPPIEVYTLPDVANAGIPPEVREQFHRDEQGRVLFFTTPPVQLAEDDGKNLGHSVRYLAEKARRAETVAKKRKEYEEKKAEAQREKKRQKVEEQKATEQRIAALNHRALQALEDQLGVSVKADLQSIYGEEWESKVDAELERLAKAQKQAIEKRKTIEGNERRRAQQDSVSLGSHGTMLFDAEPVA